LTKVFVSAIGHFITKWLTVQAMEVPDLTQEADSNSALLDTSPVRICPIQAIRTGRTNSTVSHGRAAKGGDGILAIFGHVTSNVNTFMQSLSVQCIHRE